MQVLSGKKQSIVCCYNCHFFLNQSDCNQSMHMKNIFCVKWRCPCCHKENSTPTDRQFKVYMSEGRLVNEEIESAEKVIVLIEGSAAMTREFINLPSKQYCRQKDYDQMRKEEMVAQSALMRQYLEVLAGKERLRRGRGFCWQHFIQSKSVSRLEYALWVVDQVQKQFKDVQLGFFSPDKNEEPGFRIQSASLINFRFFKEMINSNFSQISNIKRDIMSRYERSQQKTIFIVLAESQYKDILNISLIPNLKFVSLADLIDPITLRKNQFSEKVIEGVTVKAGKSDTREKSQKQHALSFLENISELKDEVAVFTKKMKKHWESIIPKTSFSSLIKKYEKKVRNSEFTLQVQKVQMREIMIECFSLISKKNKNQFLFSQIFQLFKSKLSHKSIHIYLKLHQKQHRKSYTLLWSSVKNESQHLKTSEKEKDEINFFKVFLNSDSEEANKCPLIKEERDQRFFSYEYL